MMIIKKSNPWSQLKYLYVIPVAAIAVVSYASPKAEQVSDKIVRESNDMTEMVIVSETQKNQTSTIENKDVKKESSPQKAKNKKVDVVEVYGEICENPDQMPTFPGGQEALFNFLIKNVRYPPIAERKGIQGRVFVSFIITKEGIVTNVNIAKSVDPSLNKEALRVIRMLPDWTPGRKDGKAVNVKYTVPVSFRLQ
jgi:TonB family protein